jgi:hypothetical protein
MTFTIVITIAVVTAGNAHGVASATMTTTAIASLLIRLIHGLVISVLSLEPTETARANLPAAPVQ